MEIDQDCPDLIDLSFEDRNPLETEETVAKIPITIVTGFLGAGKTPYLTIYLLHNMANVLPTLNSGMLGSAIEKSLQVAGQDGQLYEEWLELRNGCLCCNVKDIGVQAIENLMKKRGKFDYILLETTGLADPGPIASMFGLMMRFAYLAEVNDNNPVNTAVRQIAMADRLLLNKIDLLTEQELLEIEQQISLINAAAQLQRSEQSRVPVEFVLNLGAYDSAPDPPHIHTSVSTANHLQDVTTVCLEWTATTDTAHRTDSSLAVRLERWIQMILWEKHITSSSSSSSSKDNGTTTHHHRHHLIQLHVIQGVQELYEVRTITTEPAMVVAATATTEEVMATSDVGKLVLIGRGLDRDLLTQSLMELVGVNVK
ncbi:CobW/HypB/UreG, nucleotide-binding domain-containing protein [Syncephalis fuscata]|nr:CobW/HypB/UreG, nucleotide-binding domain-containing protein [Syncephalis fuscata]